MSTDKNISKWIFIGGAPRSGTSLLQAIFNQHSECTSPPESHIKESFVYSPTTKRAKSLYDHKSLREFLKSDKWIPRLNIDPQSILDKFPEGSAPTKLFTLYMEEYAAREGKSILVEGAPFNIWFMKKLYVDFPGCYILHIVRDPRDVVMSTMKAHYNTNMDFPLENVAGQFMESYLQGPLFGVKYYGERYIKIYYEDLVSHPEETIQYMCNRLNIPFEETMLSFQESSKKVAAAEEGWKSNLSKPFIKDNFNKWKTEMKLEDIIRVEYICSEFFEKEKEHYQLSEFSRTSWTVVQKALLPLRIKNLKKNLRLILKGKKTKEQLDHLPAHERLRSMGMLKED
ncbi:MAG: sulfotransferase [Bacteroidota bacterium]